VVKKELTIASAMMFIFVLFGAMGKHGLEARGFLNLDTFETGLRYHGIHAICLFLICIFQELGWLKRFFTIYAMVLLGIFCFSFSLYAYVLTGYKGFVWITPIGGMVWLCAWLLLAWDISKKGR